MYTGIKVTSKQVQDEIPSWLQNLIWYMVETLETLDSSEKDQTQCFELSTTVINDVIKQKIVHLQQKPYYRKEHIVDVKRAITAKVIVVDNQSQCFMLISST